MFLRRFPANQRSADRLGGEGRRMICGVGVLCLHEETGGQIASCTSVQGCNPRLRAIELNADECGANQAAIATQVAP